MQFITWNEQTKGCALRFSTPTNFVIASGQRFGTKTISSAKCKEHCFKDQRCKSWTFNGPKSPYPNICALNFGQPVRALKIGVNTGIISGLRQCKKRILGCAQVKCSLTVDNVIQEVKYNGVKLAVQGALNRYTEEKTISFESCDNKNPGKLSVKGRDSESGVDNCKWGGLILHCKASDTTSPWHNFKSGVDHWLDENGAVPCQNSFSWISTSRHSSRYAFIAGLKKLGAKGIWAPRQNVILTGTPPS